MEEEKEKNFVLFFKHMKDQNKMLLFTDLKRQNDTTHIECVRLRETPGVSKNSYISPDLCYNTLLITVPLSYEFPIVVTPFFFLINSITHQMNII